MLKLKVVKIVGGMAECSYSYDEEFEKFFKKETGVKKVSKVAIGRFILSQFCEVNSPTPKVAGSS